jgi:hypothetical protein
MYAPKFGPLGVTPQRDEAEREPNG